MHTWIWPETRVILIAIFCRRFLKTDVRKKGSTNKLARERRSLPRDVDGARQPGKTFA